MYYKIYTYLPPQITILIFDSVVAQSMPQCKHMNYLVSDEEKLDAELQHDLQEFELVSKGDISALDEEALASLLNNYEQAMKQR